jgi:carbon storage regulator
MLVLSRKAGERISVGGELTLTVLSIRGNAIKLGIEAPCTTTIQRSELTSFDRPPLQLVNGDET